MKRVIGIDLGTVNSCVATIVDGVPQVVPNEFGKRTCPSIYAVSATGEPIVGHKAETQMTQNRQNTIFAVKRFIGLKYDSDEVRTAMKKLPYQIVPAVNGDAWVEINDITTSPQEVSANILAYMKRYAEAALGEEVSHAVITVPAHFNDSQRQATKDAARIAGLDVMRLLNEPTAAALAYGLSSGGENVYVKRKIGRRKIVAERVVAVFDLGGGTFDVSILALSDGVFEVLSTHGDTYLGGEDFDLEIVRYVIDQFRLQSGFDIGQNRDLLQKVKLLCRDAKHALTTNASAVIEIPYVTAKDHLSILLDRKVFERLVQPILDRLTGPCNAAMSDAGLDPKDIDDVLLVGGMTRVPAVKKLCRVVFGKEPIDTVDPDEAVALGAAIQAGVLKGLVKGVSLNDVTSLSLGIEVQGGLVQTLIPRNTRIPVKSQETFTTSSPNQPQVSIHLVQGESNFAPDNISLGRFELPGLRHAPRGVPKVSVELEVDGDGIVHLLARDMDSGEEKKLDIVASSGLSEAELDQLLRQSVELKRQAAVAKEGRSEKSATSVPTDVLSQLRHQLKTEIYMTQFKLDSEGKAFRGKGRQDLEASLLSARTVLETTDNLSTLQAVLTALRESTELLDQFLDGA
ncbi:MAG: molecular chaperone DnaK [Deltaproteobacteria bacterium]|nr:molecular chaperone DnaK [Deltaproteobacteria bacterium]